MGKMKRLEWQSPKNCIAGIGCVEVAEPGTGVVLVRASGNKRRRVEMTREEWGGFISAVKNGEYDQIVAE